MNHTEQPEPSLPKVGLEHLTLRQEPLSVFVAAAAAGDAASVCVSVRHPETHDRRVLRETVSRLDDLGIPIAMGDGFLLGPRTGLDVLRRGLDILRDMRAPMANVCAYEPDADVPRDLGATADVLGEFCRIARTAGVDVLLEFTPLSHVPSLGAAMGLVEQLGLPNLRILVDTLHLVRAGEGPADLRGIDRRLIGYCQLSDGALKSEGLAAYLDEANNDRSIPGDGEFPLDEILSLIPHDVTISAEVPLRRLERTGVPPEERARRILEASRRFLAGVRPRSMPAERPNRPGGRSPAA
ncbi:sugar phosphate isomerase/epimerase family protein [Streptomyces sp. NPDC059467]|uniref:sugar phosphate isomerase/epimerase family protein n=1 Tax=Streptomyces sp. NPDC059467 TaxID=3346844 RepID=UPI0036BD3109